MNMENSNFLILIVDDDPVNAQIIMKVLRNEGYNAKFSGSGEAALQLIDEQLFDLILLDVHMPVMNGYEVCRKIKKNKNTQEIPIIFLTARMNSDNDIILGLEHGAVDYLIKPINHQELILRIKLHLNLKYHKDQLKELAMRDGLTSLYNHSTIYKFLESEINKANRHDYSFSIVMVDIDHFKLINDQFGHSMGDKVLKKVSSLLFESTRKEDLIGRYGGEEFLIILPHIGQNNAVTVAEKIRTTIEGTIWEKSDIKVTISGGVYEFHKNDSSEKMIDKADQYLYKAKNSGRNKIIFE
jgi:diguanylate cyclase (GGDEF)-like protein